MDRSVIDRSSDSIISCVDLTIKYESRIVVKNVTFEVMPGDYVCIVGENGSGKTSLMKAILGLVKPVSGSISFNGVKRAQIGYIAQSMAVQKDFPASVYEVVISGCSNRLGFPPSYSKKDKERALGYLKHLDVEHLVKKSYGELSGGQQQRVLLARALCAADNVIMLDEPASGLDSEGAEKMYELLRRLNRDMGLTIVMISHDLNTAVKYAGKILYLNTSARIFRPDQLMKKHLQN